MTFSFSCWSAHSAVIWLLSKLFLLFGQASDVVRYSTYKYKVNERGTVWIMDGNKCQWTANSHKAKFQLYNIESTYTLGVFQSLLSIILNNTVLYDTVHRASPGTSFLFTSSTTETYK